MSYDPEWKGTNKWKIKSVRTINPNPNPWGLTVGEFLTFGGDGDGKGDNDTIIGSTAAQLAKDCQWKSSDTATVTHGGNTYDIERTAITPQPPEKPYFKLTCKKTSGGIAWTATGGG